MNDNDKDKRKAHFEQKLAEEAEQQALLAFFKKEIGDSNLPPDIKRILTQDFL